MPRLITCVPASVAARVAARAKARGVPVSRYLADLIRRDVELGWPDDFFDRVAGGWKGAPLRRAPQGRFEDRAVLTSRRSDSP
jgi:hypothetical protein